MLEMRSLENKNPRDGASWLSIMFLGWINDVLRLGNKRPLTDDDLLPLLDDFKAEVLVKQVEECWLDELKRSQLNNRKPRLWKAMFRLILWKSGVMMIILRTFWALSFAFQPLCLWLVLKTLNDGPDMDMKFAIIGVALLGTTSIIKVISTQHYDYLTELWALKLKVALIGLVYKKVLSLNRYSLEATVSGNTINLVSNDVQKIERSLSQLGMVFAAPLELIISLAILWYLIGWEALVGAAIFFVLVAFQMLLARKAAKLREKAAAFTDKRLVVMNEIISGIRTVKMYAWEWNFRDVVCDLRRKEMAIIRLKGLIVSLLVVLFYTMIPIAALISVATLALTGTYLSSFTIFTLLLGLVTIRFAFCNSLSMSVYIVADAKVALDRIQVFLNDKESQIGRDKMYQTKGRLLTEPLSIDDDVALAFKGTTETKMAMLVTNESERGNCSDQSPQTFACSSMPGRASNVSSESMDSSTTSVIASHEPQSSSSIDPFLLISEASCSWNQDSSSLTFTLSNITLNVCNGKVVAITGPVGSGKSSLLTAILGELPLRKGAISYHGKVTYVPQIPWVFSGTIRDNILFGLPFDEERFPHVVDICGLTEDLAIFTSGDLTEIGQRGVSGTIRDNILFGLPFDEERFPHVVDICGLTEDLAIFTNGDLTEIGQRGVTLSGGQKARVGLARAVYSDADIYLLDDPLSAVDAKVGRKLFDGCIVGHLSGRIRLLVTHQLQYLKDVDHILVIENGSVVHEGGYTELTDQGAFSDILNASEHSEDEPIIHKTRTRSASSVSHGKRRNMELHTPLEDDVMLPEVSVGFVNDGSIPRIARSLSMVSSTDVPVAAPHHRPALDLKEEEESKTEGTVTWLLYWKYFKEGLRIHLIILLAVVLMLAQVCLIAPNWWLSRMARMSHHQQKAPNTHVIHACLVAAAIVVMAASCFFFYYLLLKAAENLHNKMTVSTIKAPVLFFDTNPAGRILNRFSKDVGCMDDVLPPLFLQALVTCLYQFCTMLVPAVTNYWLFLALLPITGVLVYYARYYLKSSRELKRIEAIKCSPVYSHISETANGLEIVHISEMSRTFLERLQRYQDENTQAFFMVVSCNRWLGIRMDLLCSVFVTIVAVAAISIRENSVLAGLALTYALQSLDQTQYGVRIATEVENLMTSVERVMTYTRIDSEPDYSNETRPPECWPVEGSLVLQDLSLVYFEGGPRILKDINFCVSSKEKVGVVGRTGAGKSSLVSALFRMPDPLGKVLIDGVDIASINLQEARMSMAVITQDPVLFGGTLKRNMDPFSQHQDQDLWTALEEVQLKTLVEDLPGQLQFKLLESGTNLSVGERQLVCLARALVQKSKIIVMDEATANVDCMTDRLIQEVIRDKFNDSTVLTIAHRLNTIMDYDKVLVLDGGRVVEFDKPDVLLKNGGLFAEMVRSQNQSGKH